MSGRIYRNNHVPIGEHLDVSIGEESILRVAHDAGYDVDMAVPYGLASMYRRAPSAHLYPIPKQRHISVREFEIYDSARLVDLALFRIVPHFVKPYVYKGQALAGAVVHVRFRLHAQLFLLRAHGLPARSEPEHLCRP